MSDLDRRRFQKLMAAAGAAQAAPVREPEVLKLDRNGWMPNNPVLPVVLYRGALSAASGDLAGGFETLFGRNGWPAHWRNGVYAFHHYHSTAHELLGFASGEARILLGGENGKEVVVRAGDAAVLPVGTGHCLIEASRDFLVVGAYPPGQNFDLCRTAPPAEAVARMAKLAFPSADPVHGPAGPLSRVWGRG